MSVQGLQLPKQQKLQKQTGPVAMNKGYASIYKNTQIGGKQSLSFKWPTPAAAKQGLYNAVSAGTGSVVGNQNANKSDGFQCTWRNAQHPFHSNGPSMQVFNNQRVASLK